MIEINLIPDVKLELLKAQRTRNAVISISIITSIAAAAVVVVLLVYLFAVQGARGVILDNNIKDRGAKLAQVEDLSKILTIQNQLSSIKSLSDQRLMASRVFETLSAITPPGAADTISFSRVLIGPGSEVSGSSGVITLEGQTESFSTMEAFRKAIGSTSLSFLPKAGSESTDSAEKEDPEQIQLASNISTTDIGYGEDATGKRVVRFTLTFEYAPELFQSRPGETISYKLNLNGNVTDSYLGIPRFTERAKDIEGGN